MPGRGLQLAGYRFGFQNQEEDGEFWGGAVAYRYRIEDKRVGRFFSVDPLAREYPWNSGYAFSENRVVDGVELEGLEVIDVEKIEESGENRFKITGSLEINVKVLNLSSTLSGGDVLTRLGGLGSQGQGLLPKESETYTSNEAYSWTGQRFPQLQEVYTTYSLKSRLNYGAIRSLGQLSKSDILMILVDDIPSSNEESDKEPVGTFFTHFGLLLVEAAYFNDSRTNVETHELGHRLSLPHVECDACDNAMAKTIRSNSLIFEPEQRGYVITDIMQSWRFYYRNSTPKSTRIEIDNSQFHNPYKIENSLNSLDIKYDRSKLVE